MVPLSDRMQKAGRFWEALVTVKDPYLQKIAQDLESMARSEGYDTYDTANLILTFVQSLPYIPDEVSTPYDEFPKFPLETVVEGGGDCEDTSILYVTLLKILGYDAVLLVYPGHVMVAVHTKDKPHIPVYVYYPKDGIEYYPAETTGEGWRVGMLPEAFSGVEAYAVWPSGGALEPRPINIQKLTEDYKTLQKKYADLTNEYNELQERYSSLQAEHQSTVEQLQEVQTRYIELQEDYEILSDKLEEMSDQLIMLRDNYTTLKNKYNDLFLENEQLRKDYDSLKSDHEQLMEEYNELKANYQEMLSEFSATKVALSGYMLGFYVMTAALAILIVLSAIRVRKS